MRRIGVFGGGRWGRVHISVLRTLMKPSDTIHWVTRHNAAENRLWLSQNAYPNVEIMEEQDSIWAIRPSAVIIATATPTHMTLLQKAIDKRVPVLCEKPFALDMKTAFRLAEQSNSKNILAGVNLEYLYAGYLRNFARVLNGIPTKSIKILWHDSIEEVRHGEAKKADAHTPHLHDALPHCWSMLQTVLPNEPFKVKAVSESGHETLVNVLLTAINVPVSFSLSRTASVRQRVLNVNDGMAVLDFSTEPGVLVLCGRESANTWGGPPPMSAALGSFLQQITEPTNDWPLSLSAALPAVALAEQGHALLLALYKDKTGEKTGGLLK